MLVDCAGSSQCDGWVSFSAVIRPARPLWINVTRGQG